MTSARLPRSRSVGRARDLADASMILQLLRAMQRWERQTGERASRRPLREAMWFVWMEPRLPEDRVRGKYPVAYLWSKKARRAVARDPRCHLVIEHVRPVTLLIDELMASRSWDADSLGRTLKRNLSTAVVLTPEEDRMVTSAGFRQSMPNDHRGDALARYRAAGLDVEGFAPLTPKVRRTP